MKSTRTVWAIRLTGLVLLLLAVVAFIHAESLAIWLGDGEWMRMNGDDVVCYGSLAVAAMSLRLLVFGLRIWVRTGIIFLIFFVLSVLVSYSPELTGDTSPYVGEGVDFAVWLYVFPAAAVSLVLATVPLFDSRFQSRRATALR